MLDDPPYKENIAEGLQGGLNGVEAVLFQRMDLLDSTTAILSTAFRAVQCRKGLGFNLKSDIFVIFMYSLICGLHLREDTFKTNDYV